jgi:autotransporter-associated beta strand protein
MIGRGHGTAAFNLGSGTLRATAGTMNTDLPMNLTGAGAGKGTIDTNGNDVTFTGNLTGTGGFTKAGTGTLTVMGSGSNFQGGTDITGGNVVATGNSLGSGQVNVGDNGTLTVQGLQKGLFARFYLTNKTDVNPNVTTGSANMSPEIASLDNLNAFVAGKPMIAAESTTARDKISVDYLENGGANGNTGLPPALIAAQNGSNPFVAYLSGKFNAPSAGDYTFSNRSDDGSAMWIDGVPVLDNNRSQGVTTPRNGTINLTAGPHDLVFGYYQGTGGAGFSIGVTLPGQGQSFTIGSELQMSNDLLSYGNDALTIGSLAGTGTAQLGNGTLITGGDNTSTTFSGPVVGAGNLVKQGNGTMTLSGANTYTGATTVNGGTLAVDSSIATSSGVTVNNGGAFHANVTQTIKSATVNAGGVVRVPTGGPHKVLTIGDGTSTTNALTINGGKVDVTTNAIIVDYAAGGESAVLQSVRNQIIAGYHGGDWQGNGIISSNAQTDTTKAVGYAQASEVLGPTGGAFFDKPDVDGTAVIARYTIYGDATLDGKVDFNDLVKLAQNYNSNFVANPTTDSWWFHGDFTYDGKVDFNDLVKLAQNYNSVLPSEAVPGAPISFNSDVAAAFALVPEPGAIGLLAAAITALGLRRRRRD